MAEIIIIQNHKLSPAKARKAAQEVADKLAEEYDLVSSWDGDVLRFERSGVDGSLTLEKGVASMSLKLGFLLRAFSSKIEAQVSEKMLEVFGGKAS